MGDANNMKWTREVFIDEYIDWKSEAIDRINESLIAGRLRIGVDPGLGYSATFEIPLTRAKAKEQTMATATTHDDVRLVVRMIHDIDADNGKDIDVAWDLSARTYVCTMPPCSKTSVYSIPEDVVLELLPAARRHEANRKLLAMTQAALLVANEGLKRASVKIARLKAESGPGISSYEYKGRDSRYQVACQGDWLEDHEG